ncbi:SAM-dependent methyltransferase [Actinocrinis puniceicyclus]|uniref:SAM-dependent methyltransferase n=1 Tax=Actinocrinis puniceicyclus TaxID=977794 RepID=A0A8J7WMY9_9ACTN|nr:SAM-dependent methyltransferase [Actinocrinis puniceicyclus]MBS2963117.1 SAM-dependent methyltransferase [Actinocrinis puniceicyclus]
MSDDEVQSTPWRATELLTPGWTVGEIDTSVAHTARMYDYFLGGKDNYEVDRDVAEQVLAIYPQVRELARENRAFLGRAVRYLARQGIRQFLDIGTGIPSPGNTTDVAHEVAPDARVVYVDNDPIVISHAGALLADHDPAHTSIVYGDLRDPVAILHHPRVRAVLDFNEPVAILLVSVLHFIDDGDRPAEIVRALMQAAPPGSFLALSHASAQGEREQELATEAAATWDRATARLNLRDRTAITSFLDGLELVEPGLVPIPWWQPDREVTADPERNWGFAAVAYKATR